MKRNEVDKSKLSPMMVQYMDIKDKYEDAIIFFRLGDFYEMFFEDAILASHELELTLTGKNCGLEERVPMCGVPFHSYLPYLEKLVNNGHKVAICEQLTDPKLKGMVERGVIQVVTKGTLMEASSIDEKTNNYVGSIYDYNHCYAISYTDVTTGNFYTELFSYDIDKLIKTLKDRFGKVTDEMIVYMHEEWFEKQAKCLDITQIKQTKTYVEIVLPQYLSKEIDGEKLFFDAYEISKYFRFSYTNNQIHIILDTIKLNKHFVYYLNDLLDVIIKDVKK